MNSNNKDIRDQNAGLSKRFPVLAKISAFLSSVSIWRFKMGHPFN